MKQIDVSRAECRRSYIFSDGFEYTIEEPKTVYITDSGSHRVEDVAGQVHYVGADWRVIKWTVMAGSPAVIA